MASHSSSITDRSFLISRVTAKVPRLPYSSKVSLSHTVHTDRVSASVCPSVIPIRISHFACSSAAAAAANSRCGPTLKLDLDFYALLAALFSLLHLHHISFVPSTHHLNRTVPQPPHSSRNQSVKMAAQAQQVQQKVEYFVAQVCIRSKGLSYSGHTLQWSS